MPEIQALHFGIRFSHGLLAWRYEMAAKRTLKYKRNKRPPLIEAVNNLIRKTLDALERGAIKASVSDLVRIVHLKQKLYPAAPVPGTVTWIDGW